MTGIATDWRPCRGDTGRGPWGMDRLSPVGIYFVGKQSRQNSFASMAGWANGVKT